VWVGSGSGVAWWGGGVVNGWDLLVNARPVRWVNSNVVFWGVVFV